MEAAIVTSDGYRVKTLLPSNSEGLVINKRRYGRFHTDMEVSEYSLKSLLPFRFDNSFYTLVPWALAVTGYSSVRELQLKDHLVFTQLREESLRHDRFAAGRHLVTLDNVPVPVKTKWTDQVMYIDVPDLIKSEIEATHLSDWSKDTSFSLGDYVVWRMAGGSIEYYREKGLHPDMIRSMTRDCEAVNLDKIFFT